METEFLEETRFLKFYSLTSTVSATDSNVEFGSELTITVKVSPKDCSQLDKR